VDLLLDGLAVRFTEGYAAAAPTLKRALRAALREEAGDDRDILWTWVRCRAAIELWDDETLHVLAAREIDLARETGVLSELPIALCFRAASHLLAGDFVTAAAALEEAKAIPHTAANTPMPYTSILLRAWRGDEPGTSDAIAASIADARVRGDGRAITAAHLATALYSNGLGRHEAALAAAQRAWDHEELAATNMVAVELVEAAVRCDRPELAAEALAAVSVQARATGTDWALGIEARCRALLSAGRQADDLYREAIERLGRTRVAVELARTHLLYGEFLRREGRLVEARNELRVAHERFELMGAAAFTARAATELAATGERRRRLSAGTRESLTAQQARIARLARAGQSNQQIGAQLFLSPRTVEYHLNKVFRKLDISSRVQLEHALPADAREVLGAA
jgi:DNA-binding CsgD family transcriptional regulator